MKTLSSEIMELPLEDRLPLYNGVIEFMHYEEVYLRIIKVISQR